MKRKVIQQFLTSPYWKPLITGLRDIEGNIYTSVIIGTQEWLVENLKTTKYNNGEHIPYRGESGPPYANMLYNDDISNKEIYGYLYTWLCALDIRGINYITRDGVIENDWRIPTYADTIKLIVFCGGQGTLGKLKETGYTHWNLPNGNATDQFGFKARGAGNLDTSLSPMSYGMGETFTFWVTGNSGSNMPRLNNINGDIDMALNTTTCFGASIRLVRDI